MASITALPTDAPRTGSGARQRVRAALAQARSRATAAVSTVRLSPVLTVGGLSSAVASAWTTFGLGAGLAALSAAFFLFDWSRDQ